MTFEEFQNTIIKKFGKENVFFRHVGEHGWKEIKFDNNNNMIMQQCDGPHWVDAEPQGIDPIVKTYKTSGKLLGHYSFNNGLGKFFFKVN